jgi:Protein of unknown function (DUF2911)
VKAFSLRTVLACSLLLAMAVMVAAQTPAAAPRPYSPRRSTELAFGPRNAAKKVIVNYGSPAARGRKVMGDLVPMDKIWRLGANEATLLTTEVPLLIGGKEVPAGSYTLFVTPGKDKWVLQINKTTGVWGIPYKPEYDATILTTADMKVEATTANLDRFLITLDRVGPDAMLVCEWENTKAWVSVAEKK